MRGDLVEPSDARDLVIGEGALLEEAVVRAHAAVRRNSLQVAVREDALSQGSEADDALSEPLRGLLEAVLLHRPVQNIVPVLVDHKRNAHFRKDGCRLLQSRAVVVGEACVQGFAAPDCLLQSAHGLLEGRLGVHPVMIENIDVLKAHSLKRLIEACQKILAAPPVPVRALPHRVACFGRDDHLVPVGQEIFFQDPAEVLLGTAGLRPVIVCQVKVRNSVVEGREAKLLHIGVGARVAEVVPKAQRYRGKEKAALSAAVVFHRVVSFVICSVHGLPP